MELSPRWDAVNFASGYNTSATSIVVDNGSYFRAGHIIRNTDTGEQMLVTAVSTNTLTVTRAFGSTAAAAITDNDSILIIGDASAEGADSPAVKTTQESKVTNYTQIFRTPFDVTETADASEMYGGRDLSYLRKKHGIEHKKDMERAFLFGEKKEDTSGTQPRRTTAGLNSYVTTNRTDASGALTEAEFETFCRSLFRYGSKKKTLFASPLVVSAINSWAGAKLQVVPSDKTFGISISQYVTGHGTLNLVKHDLLEQDYSGYAFGVDTSNVMYRPLRDTSLKMNIQDADSDTQKDEYLTEAGLQVNLEKTHAVLYGVTSYS